MAGVHDPGLFVLAVLLLNLTPGPDTAYIVGRSVAQGRLAGIVSALGIGAGCCVHALLAAAGLTALVAASPTAFAVVKYLGAAYLVWLGVALVARTVTRNAPVVAPDVARRVVGTSAGAGRDRAGAPLRLFAQGFMTNILNPKVVMFFLSFLPQFIDPAAPHRVQALLILGAVFVAMSIVYCCTVAWLAGQLTQRLRASVRIARWLERGTGTAFVAIGCKLALE